MLFCLMDGCARTSTELSIVAEVSPSTASAHLARMKEVGLLAVAAQGKHRYYRLAGSDVGEALETLAVLSSAPGRAFVPSTPKRLRGARTCYDHIAGRLGVAMHDAMLDRGWLEAVQAGEGYAATELGADQMREMGIDVAGLLAQRRRFACGCLDWSERRPHLGGRLGAALLDLALRRGWTERDGDARSLSVTEIGEREIARWFGV